jgi:antitoxin (DNA-binding transcriptional repressor) of toxin-antitoxin stability system
MITISIDAAGKDLPRLIERACSGEEIAITRDDQVVARLVGVAGMRKPRTPGRLQGQVDLPDAFYFDPLPDDELKRWSGEDDGGQ